MYNPRREIESLCEGYFVGEIIGEGSFGVVYKGTHKKTNRTVALKCINMAKLIGREINPQLKAIKERFLRDEVELMRRCDNDHIIKCEGVFENGMYKILVLEFCEGGDLFNEISREGRFHEKKAVEVLEQLLFGFATLQHNKIIHRDFKSDNVFVHKGYYKIADFGLAKRTDALNKVERGTLVGTKSTMAPEVMYGRGYGVQADMWSLGVVYFEMLFGALPFSSDIGKREIENTIHYLQQQSCSSASKEFLTRIFVMEPEGRLKWSELYNMFQASKSIFTKEFPQQPIAQFSKSEHMQLSDPQEEKEHKFKKNQNYQGGGGP